MMKVKAGTHMLTLRQEFKVSNGWAAHNTLKHVTVYQQLKICTDNMIASNDKDITHMKTKSLRTCQPTTATDENRSTPAAH
jgi:hypothetical protein